MKKIKVRIGNIKSFVDREEFGIKAGDILEAVIMESPSTKNAYGFITYEDENNYVVSLSLANEKNINQFEIIENPFDEVPKEIKEVYKTVDFPRMDLEIDYEKKYRDAVNTIKEMSKLL